jgi:hypothetical protein
VKIEREWWWLSFTDDDARSLGACIVEGADLPDAIGEAWRRGLNPGGRVDAASFADPHQHADLRNRRITAAELAASARLAELDLDVRSGTLGMPPTCCGED